MTIKTAARNTDTAPPYRKKNRTSPPSSLLSHSQPYTIYRLSFNFVLAIFRLLIIANIDIKACRRDCVTVERNKITDKKAARYCAWSYYPVGIPDAALSLLCERSHQVNRRYGASFSQAKRGRQFVAGAIRGKSVREGSDLPPRRAALPSHFRVFRPDRRA